MESVIAYIHGIPLYGKLKASHLNTLKRLEKLTFYDEWKGIKGIYCTDVTFETGLLGAYITAKKGDKTAHCTINMNYNDGSLNVINLKYNDYPAIFISSFNDEYSFAVNTLHELGHHVNEDNFESKKDEIEKEVNAHLFAISKVNRKDFKCKREPNFYYWNDAKINYIKKLGLDCHIDDKEPLIKHLKRPINFNNPYEIHNKFKKEIKLNQCKRERKLPSPWKVKEVI